MTKDWMHAAAEVKWWATGTHRLNFLLRYKLNSWFSPKSHLVITPLVLPFIIKRHRSTAFSGDTSSSAIHWPLDISLTVGVTVTPYWPKVVGSGPHISWPLGSTGNGRVGCLPPPTPFLLVLCLPRRVQFSGPFHCPPLTHLWKPIFSIICSTFSHCTVSIHCHQPQLPCRWL